MNLRKFREQTKNFTDDFELVISNIGNRESIDTWGVGYYTKGDENKKYYCYIIPHKVKMSFKEFVMYIKELFFDWFENNVDENTRNDIYFWINPIGGFSTLDINLRGMAGLTIWHRVAWYNLNLLFFKVGGKLRLLNKNKQDYYDALEKYKKEK